MRNLLFLYLLFLSSQSFAGSDSLNLVLTEEEMASYPVAANALLEGKASFEKGVYDSSLANYQKALMNLVPDFKGIKPEENPSGKSLFANSILSKALEGKANVFEEMAKGKGGIAALENALTCRELIFEVDRHLSHAGQKYSHEHYDDLVKLAFSLYEKTNNPSVLLRVFRSVEKSRKVRSLENLRNPTSNLIANVPADLVEKLHQQKLNLDQQLLSYLSEKGTSNETKAEEVYKTVRKAYQNALFDTKKSYPDFYRLQYDESVVTVGEIQNRISDKDEVVIAFYDTPDHIYGFVIALNGFRAQRIKKDFPIELWVKELRTHIESYASGDKKTACGEYRAIAHKLYQKVVQPLGALPQKLVIIPDGAVSFLPFSALLSEAVEDCNFSNYPFMLRQHQISYHYGADLFARAAYREHEDYKNFVGISSGLGLGAINKVMGGKVFDSNNMTVFSLIKETGEASLLHLAIPAKTNEAQASRFYLKFPDTSLFPETKIFDLEINAQLAVLSHCELGSSTDRLLDIVQGFQYAGAQSVVSSLWKNDEQSTIKVMSDFYTRLRNGMTKDAALRNACLSLWKEKDVELCHPVHWATFVPVGDMDAVKKRNWYLYLIGIAPLVAMIYFWRKYFAAKGKKEEE